MKNDPFILKSKDSKQTFSLFTEEQWKEKSISYPSEIQHFFSGKKKEFFVLTHQNKTEFLIGLGSNPKAFELQEVGEKYSSAYSKNIQSIESNIICDLSPSDLEAFVLGLFLGSYQYPFSEKHPIWNSKFKLDIPNSTKKSNEKLAQKIDAFCTGQFAAMDWLNKPANFKKTPQITDFLKKISKEYAFDLQIFNRKESEKLGLGAFVAVNQGSAEDCAFSIIKYNGGKKNSKTIGLIGKCVLFDTGGISIKGSTNLHYMKSDMGGATAVIGTLITAAKLQLPINIVAILPVTDNAVSDRAYLPSDVVTAYNGKTIEVLNTDAEGRMTLADALAYHTKNFKSDYLIDLATLTGSAVRMFGDTCGALFSNDEGLQKALITSGDKTNQRLWNMPMWDVWNDDFKSDVADFKNISMKPVGDCIVAAKFLEHFLENDVKWAHLDIAGVAFGNTNYSKDKAATGYGVQLLIDFIENLA